MAKGDMKRCKLCKQKLPIDSYDTVEQVANALWDLHLSEQQMVNIVLDDEKELRITNITTDDDGNALIEVTEY